MPGWHNGARSDFSARWCACGAGTRGDHQAAGRICLYRAQIICEQFTQSLRLDARLGDVKRVKCRLDNHASPPHNEFAAINEAAQKPHQYGQM